MLTDYSVFYGKDKWGEPSRVHVTLGFESTYVRVPSTGGAYTPPTDFELSMSCYERIELQSLIRVLHEAIQTSHGTIDHGKAVYIVLPNSSGKLTMMADYSLVVRLLGRLMEADDEVFGGMHSTHMSQPGYEADQ